MTTELPDTHSSTPADKPLALKSNEGLGPLYAERDHVAQGDYYIRHVMAMTSEGLHYKSAFAAELAHRDMEIDRLRQLLARALPMLKEHADYANSAPVWRCTGREANTLNALIPEIEAVLGPNARVQAGPEAAEPL